MNDPGTLIIYKNYNKDFFLKFIIVLNFLCVFLRILNVTFEKKSSNRLGIETIN